MMERVLFFLIGLLLPQNDKRHERMVTGFISSGDNFVNIDFLSFYACISCLRNMSRIWIKR
jgi:hypothetical protein